MPDCRKISTSSQTTKNKRKQNNRNKNTTVIENNEKHLDKDEGKKRSGSTDNHDPETYKPLKVVNINRFLKVKIIEKYKVTDK